MKRYFEAPEALDFKGLSIFLGGGISNCPDWQLPTARNLIHQTELIVVNPRRKGKSKEDIDPNEQIKWEFEGLELVDFIMFWFPKETDAPIALFELGKWLVRDKPLFIGCHPKYSRKLDIEVQTKLEKPDTVISYSLEDLWKHIIEETSTL